MRKHFIVLFCLLFGIFSTNCVFGQKKFSTWVPWQVDSVAAAWVLKRYVYSDAVFASVPRGTPLSADEALDTPDSPYRRNGRRTAFDETLRINGIRFECSEKFSNIVRLLELAPWRKSENPTAEKFEIELNQLMPQGPTQGGLEAAFEYIDRFCVTTCKKGER